MAKVEFKIILDNHSAHVSKETNKWLAEQRDGRFSFVFTPKHGSWLNLVEGFFSKMARSDRSRSMETLYSHVRRFKQQARKFLACPSSCFSMAAAGQGRRHDHETTVDHALMRGLVTAGPVIRRGASSV